MHSHQQKIGKFLVTIETLPDHFEVRIERDGKTVLEPKKCSDIEHAVGWIEWLKSFLGEENDDDGPKVKTADPGTNVPARAADSN